MPKVSTTRRAVYTPNRYVLIDWAGPVGVYSIEKELARDLWKIEKESNEEVALYMTVLQFKDGRISENPVKKSIRAIMKRYPKSAFLCLPVP